LYTEGVLWIINVQEDLAADLELEECLRCMKSESDRLASWSLSRKSKMVTPS